MISNRGLYDRVKYKIFIVQAIIRFCHELFTFHVDLTEKSFTLIPEPKSTTNF